MRAHTSCEPISLQHRAVSRGIRGLAVALANGSEPSSIERNLFAEHHLHLEVTQEFEAAEQRIRRRVSGVETIGTLYFQIEREGAKLT